MVIRGTSNGKVSIALLIFYWNNKNYYKLEQPLTRTVFL